MKTKNKTDKELNIQIKKKRDNIIKIGTEINRTYIQCKKSNDTILKLNKKILKLLYEIKELEKKRDK